MFFYQMVTNTFNTANINGILTDRKFFYVPLKPSFFKLLTEKYFKLFSPKI